MKKKNSPSLSLKTAIGFIEEQCEILRLDAGDKRFMYYEQAKLLYKHYKIILSLLKKIDTLK